MTCIRTRTPREWRRERLNKIIRSDEFTSVKRDSRDNDCCMSESSTKWTHQGWQLTRNEFQHVIITTDILYVYTRVVVPAPRINSRYAYRSAATEATRSFNTERERGRSRFLMGCGCEEHQLPSPRLTLHSTKLCTKFRIFRKKYFCY